MKDCKRFLKLYENDKNENVKETTIYAKYPSSLLTLYSQFKILQFLIVFLLFSLYFSYQSSLGRGR